MTDDPGAAGANGGGGTAREKVMRGVHRGVGAITALREAMGETLADARERGDLTTDRAREVIGRAVERAREGTSEARDRFDFVPRQEFDALRSRVEALEARLSGQEPPSPAPAEEPTVTG